MPVKHKYVKIEENPNEGSANQNRFLHLPEIATASQVAAGATNEGGIFYDATLNQVMFSDGANWAAVASAGLFMFKTIVPTAGANVVADTATDTLTLKSADGSVVITGTAATDTLDFAVGATIANANVAAGAAIAFSKLAALTAGHILVGSAANVATDVAVSGVIAISNAGVTSFSDSACPRRPVIDVPDTTLAVTGATRDTIYTVATGAAADTIINLDAGTTVGYELTIDMGVDGGFNIVVTCGGADVIHHAGAINSVTATMADAGDYLVIRKVRPDVWQVIAERGNTFA